MEAIGRNIRPEGQAERMHKFAHDLRNRLGGIQQVLRSVREDIDAEERATLCEFGEKQFFKAMSDVESLLDDLGVDRNPALHDVTVVRAEELVHTAVELMLHRTQRKEQRTELTTDPELKVRVDIPAIEQLIAGLLSNASKFSPKGSVLRVTLERAGDHAALSIEDPGVGLTAADLERVFTRYAWLSSTSTDGEVQGRSSLARAHACARSHGGALVATSDGPGHGSRFTLRLPLAD
ncbi:MAG: HAMP domain-containing sensor histidine kinase [Flavobacteriales bacterium]